MPLSNLQAVNKYLGQCRRLLLGCDSVQLQMVPAQGIAEMLTLVLTRLILNLERHLNAVVHSGGNLSQVQRCGMRDQCTLRRNSAAHQRCSLTAAKPGAPQDRSKRCHEPCKAQHCDNSLLIWQCHWVDSSRSSAHSFVGRALDTCSHSQ